MTSVDRPLLAVRSTADLISAVPFLLGFHPSESVVVVAMCGSRVTFVARADLPPSGRPTDSAEAAGYIGAVVDEQRVETATVIGYGSADRVTPVVRELGAVLDRAGIRVFDLLRVTDNRYWSYTCDNPECCPPEGTAFDPTTSEVAAAAVFAGQVALPDRETLAAQVAPVSGPARESMREAETRAEDRLAELLAPAAVGEAALYQAGTVAVEAAVRRHSQGGTLTDDEVAWLGLLLLDLPVRDHAWERTDGDDRSIALWTDVLRRVDPELAAAPASLLAFAAWRAGQGALALVALDRAFEALPDYSMALLMDDVLRRGVRPSRLGSWPKPPRASR